MMQKNKVLPSLKPLRKADQQIKHSLPSNTQASSQINASNVILYEGIKSLTNTIVQLTKQIKNMKDDNQRLGLQGVQRVDASKSLQLQSRFQLILYPLPHQPPSLCETERSKLLINWIGKMLKHTISISFNLYKKNQLQQNKLKSYCSQNILLNLINLTKAYKITSKQLQTIDDQLCNNLLPYFLMKYPESEQMQVNNRFSNMLIQRDVIQDNQYDFVYRSGIKFQFDGTGNYNGKIMEFLNYVIKMPNKQITLFKQKQDQLHNKPENLINNRQKIPIRKTFFSQMQNLFKMIQDQQSINTMQQFNPKSNTQNKVIKTNQTISKSERQKQQYRDKVRGYSGYLIGQKLSQGIKPYTQYEINSGNLKLKSSALMRVVTKWCEQLEKCYDEGQILNRENPFRMKNGQQKYLNKSKILCLNFLLQFQKKNIEKQMQKIIQNNFHHQSIEMQCDLHEQLQKYTKQQAKVGQFCTKMLKNNTNYLIKYLNLLIHGINKATQKFNQLIWWISSQQYQGSYKRLQQVQDKQQADIFSIFTDVLNSKNRQNIQKIQMITSQVPELITFKIGDLLRCKCSSKQNEIISLYKEVQRRNKQNPLDFKILRIKNRLNKGNKDILMNILYKNSMIVQMQLSIKQQKSKFVQYSNKFNHYLYELKRAKFGAISQMCSIWISQDLKAKFYLEKYQKINRRKKLSIEQRSQIFKKTVECCSKSSNILLPFRCNKCKYFYSEFGVNDKHSFCQKCQQSVCFLCLFQSGNLQQKIKILPELKKSPFPLQQSSQQVQCVPQIGGLIINLVSRQKQLRKFFSIKYKKKFYFFEFKNQTSGLKLIQKFQNYLIPYQFLKQNIIFSSIKIQAQLKKQYDQVYLLSKKYFVEKYLKQNSKTQKKSLTLIDEQINSTMFELQGQKQWLNVRRLNLSENKKLGGIQNVINKFPNVQFVVLNSINLDNIPENFWIKVTHISLSNNKITSIKNLCKCINLIQANVSYNFIQQIPKQIQALKNLKSFNLTKNLLKQIQSQIQTLKMLTSLSFSQNQKLTHISQKITTLKQIQILQMQNLKKLSYIPENFNNFQKLTVFKLCKLVKVTKIPNSFSKLKNIKELTILKNFNLVDLGQSFQSMSCLETLIISENGQLKCIPILNLKRLTYLKIYKNEALQKIKDSFQNLSSLEYLEIMQNTQLKILPQNFTGLISLKKLKLNKNQIQSLSSNFGHMPQLKQLQFKQNTIFSKLPTSISKLTKLQKLFLKNGDVLMPMHNQLKCMTSLKQLQIMNINLEVIEEQFFNSLNGVQILNISDNDNLIQLPNSLGNMSNLKQLQIKNNRFLKSLPQTLKNLKNLTQLNVYKNKCLKISEKFYDIMNVRELTFASESEDYQLQKIPNSISKFKQLNKLVLSYNVTSQQITESIGELSQLQTLQIYYFEALEHLPVSLSNLSNLKQLILLSLPKIIQIPQSISKLTNLQNLRIDNCSHLSILPQSLGNLPKLQKLYLISLPSLQVLPKSMGNLKSLYFLFLMSLRKLQYLPDNIGNLKKLQFLSIQESEVKQLPQSITKLTKLKKLQLVRLKQLKSVPKFQIREHDGLYIKTNLDLSVFAFDNLRIVRFRG